MIWGSTLAVGLTWLLALLVGLTWLRDAPLEPPESQLLPPGVVLLDARGQAIHRDVRDGLRLSARLDQVAPAVVDATVATEDQRFFQHPGVDPVAIVRSLIHWQYAPSGASTITQQLARRLYLRGAQMPVVVRKVREAIIALQLEARYSKTEILTLYLNEVYYGRGAYGIEAAARTYFGVAARNLTTAQAALLAGLPQLPAVYDSTRNPNLVRSRQQYVLRRMVDTGRLTAEAARRAEAEPFVHTPAVNERLAPHFNVFVQSELQRLLPDLAGTTGLIVETTLDPDLQREAERSVRAHLQELGGRNATGAAVVALDPRNGHVLAMVGGPDFWDDEQAGQVNMAVQPRHPGSALKPFLYAAAFERGLTAATPLLDVPTSFDSPTGLYTPLNYDRLFHGTVSARVALASSYNVPAVRLQEQLGTDTFLEMLHRVGLRSLTDADVYGLSLALGGGEVELLDLTAAYGAIASGGLFVEPLAILRVRDTSGRTLYEAPTAETKRVLSPQDAYLLADVLADPAARRPGFGERTPLDTPFRVGVKTGTTTESRDNWTIGFTPHHVVGVWVGNPTGVPMDNTSGVDGAGPSWRDVITAAGRGTERRWLERPAGLRQQAVCTPTGLAPGPECPSVVDELFVEGTVPVEREQFYERAHGGSLVQRVQTEAYGWALEAGVAARPAEGEEPRLVIRQPTNDSVLLIAPELVEQQVLFRAIAPPAIESVAFLVDGVEVERTHGPDARAIWKLEPGHHHLEVVTHLPSGRSVSDSVRFEVRQPERNGER